MTKARKTVEKVYIVERYSEIVIPIIEHSKKEKKAEVLSSAILS